MISQTVDPELLPGARNAIRVCLNVQPHERVTLITDRECADIAASLVHEIDQVGAPHQLFVLEDVAPRPLTGLPAVIAADMEQSQVSIFAVHVQQNELASRMAMTDIVNRRKMRHAHMVNINRQIMLEGMRADYHKVDRLSTKVLDLVRVRQRDPRDDARGQQLPRDAESELPLAEDERPHQPRQVGQPARRRDLHDARRSQRHLRD